MKLSETFSVFPIVILIIRYGRNRTSIPNMHSKTFT